MLSQGHRHCPPATGEIARAARGDEPRPAAPTTNDATRITSHATRFTRRARRGARHVVEIYSWFTEGFDTKDLQEAKVLLDSL